MEPGAGTVCIVKLTLLIRCAEKMELQRLERTAPKSWSWGQRTLPGTASGEEHGACKTLR